jgi:tryptophan synthase beta chain
MHTLGHSFMPPAIHAGGLRYHGMSPQVSALVHNGDVEAKAVNQLATFEAAIHLCQSGSHHARAGIGPRHSGGDGRSVEV